MQKNQIDFLSQFRNSNSVLHMFVVIMRLKEVCLIENLLLGCFVTFYVFLTPQDYTIIAEAQGINISFKNFDNFFLTIQKIKLRNNSDGSLSMRIILSCKFQGIRVSQICISLSNCQYNAIWVFNIRINHVLNLLRGIFWHVFDCYLFE